jgi:hypothetical protein
VLTTGHFLPNFFSQLLDKRPENVEKPGQTAIATRTGDTRIMTNFTFPRRAFAALALTGLALTATACDDDPVQVE